MQRSVVIDIGALDPNGAGISTYIRSLLPRLACQSALSPTVYGRHPKQLAGLALAGVNGRWDHLPFHAGRITSLVTSLPVWAHRDRPRIYWGPAHRLPLSLPRQTAAVVTVHDLAWWRVPDTLRRSSLLLDRRLMGPALRRAQAILAISQATAADLRERFPECAGKIVVTPLAAADLPDTDPATPWPTDWPRPPYWLFVGTLEPRKNLRRLLQAYARAVEQAPDLAPIAIAGSQGWGQPGIREWLDPPALHNRVHRLDRVADTQLDRLYRHAHAFIMPSLYEGFGLPLLEAMSRGVPVITSNRSAMPEVAGEGGLLIDPDSVDAIAHAIITLHQSPTLHSRLSLAARQHARTYTWDRTAEQTLDVLLSL